MSRPDSSDDPRLLDAARAYLADLEAGRPPDRAGHHARHPELAAALEECFDGIDLAHAAGGLGPAPAAELPPEPLGDFRIVREVGRGGMGVVYEAVQLSLGRRVALKVLPFAAALDAKQLQRFKTEAHAAAQLHHTNIVPVYAVGCERGVHFYAMQLIDGRPLDAVIRELRGGPARTGDSTVDYLGGPTRPAPAAPVTTTTRGGRGRDAYRAAAHVAAQAAEALDYAHEAGVVHRDVKPANLLLDGRGNVWVTDFGLAQVSVDGGVTRTGDVFGTLRYMSPEQAAGRRLLVDHRTDVYSLGATLYELLTLEPIFPGQDRASLLYQILHDEPRPPRAIDRGVPADLETIALKAVAKSPQDRYATAGEMAADLRRFLGGMPVMARRPTAADRVRKWLRRHPAGVAAGVTLLALAAVGLAVATAVVSREKLRAERALERERERAAEAEERFRLARRSADDMIRVADEELADHPFQETARRRLLEAALAYYQEFVRQRGDDPAAQADLEPTRKRVENILADLAAIRGGWQHMLLSEPAVQGDLKLSPDQRRRLADALKKVWDRRSEPAAPAYRPGAEERNRQMVAEMREHQAAVEAILTPAQLRRLGQVALQVRGPSALRDPEVAAVLALTPEQTDRVRAFEAGPFAGGPRHGPRSPDRWLDVLTPEQRSRWQELTGEPYTGPRAVPFRGPPRLGGPPDRRPD